MPKPVVPETWFYVGLELNTCCLELSQLSIGISDRYLAARLPHQVTSILNGCWMYWKQYSILHCYYLDQEPHHHPLAPEPPWPYCEFFACPSWSPSVSPSGVGLFGSYSSTQECHHDVWYDRVALEWIYICGIYSILFSQSVLTLILLSNSFPQLSLPCSFSLLSTFHNLIVLWLAAVHINPEKDLQELP